MEFVSDGVVEYDTYKFSDKLRELLNSDTCNDADFSRSKVNDNDGKFDSFISIFEVK